MSKYYNINGLKVRVSDHEPNHSRNWQRGANDIELYVKSADNKTLSVISQLERICDKQELEINDFQQVVNDWQDGTYDKNYFAPVVIEEEEEEEEEEPLSSLEYEGSFKNIMRIIKIKHPFLTRYNYSEHMDLLRSISKETQLKTKSIINYLPYEAI
jgi:hypothetical protein